MIARALPPLCCFPVLLFCLYGSITTAQTPAVVSGSIRHFERFPSANVEPRNVDVWLPDGYDTSKKYAVLYMHDGQMLFDSIFNWNHQEWGVDETMGRLLKTKKIRDCIVVGIWNIPERRRMEYCPQKAFSYLSPADRKRMLAERDKNTGKLVIGDSLVSDRYLKFIVSELKPFIDSAFSTRKDQRNTFIAGSSMGGLISMYAICEHPSVFYGAACLSTHWTGIFRAEDNPVPAAFLGYLRDHLPSPRNHRIYFDHGTATLDALYGQFQVKADAVMRKKGYTRKNWVTRVFEGEDHSEKAWAKRLAIPLQFILRK